MTELERLLSQETLKQLLAQDDSCLVSIASVKRALKQESTTKNDLGVDCVSRKRVLEWLENATDDSIEHAIDSNLEFIPSVTPIRPKGHWEHGKELSKEYRGRILVDVTYADWHCSNCNYVIKGTVKPKWNYCPNCGADMREVEE